MTDNSNKTRNVKQRKDGEFKSYLSGQQITFDINFEYHSNIMNSFVTNPKGRNLGVLFGMFERLGGLLRLVSRDKEINEMVKAWIKTNDAIAEAQIAELKESREIIEEGVEDLPMVNIPSTYSVKIEASHPILNKMSDVLRAVNCELMGYEKLYFAGLIDDEEYRRTEVSALGVLGGLIDRIAKATKPGQRKGGRFNQQEFYRVLRQGHILQFVDVPSDCREAVEKYNKEYKSIEGEIKKEVTLESKEEEGSAEVKEAS